MKDAVVDIEIDKQGSALMTSFAMIVETSRVHPAGALRQIMPWTGPRRCYSRNPFSFCDYFNLFAPRYERAATYCEGRARKVDVFIDVDLEYENVARIQDSGLMSHDSHMTLKEQ